MLLAPSRQPPSAVESDPKTNRRQSHRSASIDQLDHLYLVLRAGRGNQNRKYQDRDGIDPPVVSDIPDQTIAEGSSFTSINLDAYVSDVDNSDAEMTWTFSGNSQLSVSITNRVATITVPNADWNGAETITFRATDPGGLYDEDAATFTVTAVSVLIFFPLTAR